MRPFSPKKNCLLAEPSVADTGIGMTPEQMGKLFQEFSQAGVVAVLVDTIQRASCAMCNVRGLMFMNCRAVTTVRCVRLFPGCIEVALAISLMLMTAPAFAQIEWTLPSAYPADNFHTRNLQAFAMDLAEATGRKLSIKIYPNASLLPISVIKSAVRIMTNSNLVDCRTGRSAGFAPLRMLPV